MRHIYTLALLTLSFFSRAQTISTIAGTGAFICSSGGGLAVAASLGQLTSITIDTSGNIYIGSSGCHCLKRITPLGMISAVAGTGIAGNTGDGGPATIATIGIPTGLAADRSGNIYICDGTYHVIRKINATGIISTIAGNVSPAGGGYSGDGGPATASALNNPLGVAVDSAGVIYIADANNNVIRKISASGIISTISGTGIPAYSGDGGPALAADLQFPRGITADNSGNIYFSSACRVRKIDVAGIITTVAGNGTAGYSGDGAAATAAEVNYPEGICADDYGNIFIADLHNNMVRRVDAGGIITTIAGSGFPGDSGDGGLPTLAGVNGPQGVALDKRGFAYIAELNGARVRKVDTCGSLLVDVITGDSVICSNASVQFLDDSAGGQWFVLDTTLATVSADGMVTGVGNGPATLVYGIANSCSIAYAFKNIMVGPYAGIIESTTFHRIGPPDTFCYYAFLKNTNGKPGGIWGVTDTTIATISASGKVDPLVYNRADTAFYVVTDSCGSDTAFYPFVIIISCEGSASHIAVGENEIAVYPNPAPGEVMVESVVPITDIAIINTVGQVVYHHAYNSRQVMVNVGNMPPGLYLIRVNGAGIKRFLKE